MLVKYCGALSNHPVPKKPALSYIRMEDGFFRRKKINKKTVVFVPILSLTFTFGHYINSQNKENILIFLCVIATPSSYSVTSA